MPSCNHGTRNLARVLKVILGAARYVAESELLARPPAEQNSKLVLQLLLGG